MKQRINPAAILPAGLLALASALFAWLGWRGGLLEGGAESTLFLVVLGGLWNAALFALILLIHRRLTRAEALRQGYNTELRHLRRWAGEEGRLRKEGLIRDLNALGAAPVELEQALLAGADLKGVDLRGCSLKGADLQGADLQGALLDGADLWGADLTGANLTMASLRGASLRGSDLTGAQLVKADLEGASLHRALLVNTNLHGTALRTAHLERARFAQKEEGDFPLAVHSSVEDWIRERLDAKGFYDHKAGNGDLKSSQT